VSGIVCGSGMYTARRVTRPKLVVRLIGFLCVMMVCLSSETATQTHPVEFHASRAFHVVHYDVQVEPDLTSKSITGKVVIRVVTLNDDVATIEFDCGDLTIDSVRDAGDDLSFKRQDARLVVALRAAAKAHKIHDIEIEYHGSPKRGVSFFVDEQQVYTAFSTSHWMVCLDAPDDKATVNLGVVVPASWTVVANGRLVRQQELPNHRVLHQYRQDTAIASYTFGFAAGKFRTVVQNGSRVKLRYLASGMSDAEVRRVFGDTGDMLTFFESRSGVRYPDSSYTQVLAAGAVQQEMSSFAVLGGAYGAWVLDHPQDVSLGAHELAHQWWGNSVTCRDWNHFWLNEGMATFMAAAYIEHRFGRDAYLRLIEEYRSSYERVRNAGQDKPLVFQNWLHPTANDRTLVYRKGAYVLHALRDQLGDEAFWAGIRLYTRTYVGNSVTSGDFQAALERATGRNLSQFFDKWVY
jgi:aminopeptidase N